MTKSTLVRSVSQDAAACAHDGVAVSRQSLPFSTNLRGSSQSWPGAVDRGRRRIVELYRVPRLREHLGNPIAHRPCTDHADRRYRQQDLQSCRRLCYTPLRLKPSPPPARRRCRRPGTASRCRASCRRSQARRAASSETRAPLAPMGWPSATAPPWTLTRAGSRPSAGHGHALTDQRLVELTSSTSSIPARLLFSLLTASTGASCTSFG